MTTKALKYFHGFDNHKTYTTISKKDLEGKEILYIPRCYDLFDYIGNLTHEDAVVLEASTGAFFLANLIESKGAVCFIINPYKFKIIKESWNKTDKKDSRNMSYALWASIIFSEYKLPLVYKPEKTILELRKLFTQLNLLNKQIRSLKNNIQAVLVDNGVSLAKEEVKFLLHPKRGKDRLKTLTISDCSYFCIEQNLELLWFIEEKKKQLVDKIYQTGEPYKGEVILLISIKGVTPLLALAFLADVADVSRFRKLKEMNAYLGVCPTIKSSGGHEILGHINRQSRKLSRTLFTQSVYHIANSSHRLKDFYQDLKKRRGVGRARIAVLRKIFGIMRRMLLTGELYRSVNMDSYENKVIKYERSLEKLSNIQKAA